MAALAETTSLGDHQSSPYSLTSHQIYSEINGSWLDSCPLWCLSDFAEPVRFSTGSWRFVKERDDLQARRHPDRCVTRGAGRLGRAGGGFCPGRGVGQWV